MGRVRDPSQSSPQAFSSEADEGAFLVDLDRRYRAPLISYFEKRIRESFDVDDLVQEVFVRLARRAELGDVERIDGYVFQTAANVIRDRARRRAARRMGEHDELIEETLPGDALTPERVLLGREALDRVLSALEELPKRTRDVFVLRRYEGMKLEEIATHMRVSVSGVRFHMAKAKAHLARRLGKGL